MKDEVLHKKLFAECRLLSASQIRAKGHNGVRILSSVSGGCSFNSCLVEIDPDTRVIFQQIPCRRNIQRPIFTDVVSFKRHRGQKTDFQWENGTQRDILFHSSHQKLFRNKVDRFTIRSLMAGNEPVELVGQLGSYTFFSWLAPLFNKSTPHIFHYLLRLRDRYRTIELCCSAMQYTMETCVLVSRAEAMCHHKGVATSENSLL